jgi:VanZ family protein
VNQPAVGLPWPVLRRAAFWMYAAALLVLTHWPNMRIESNVVDRLDLIVHLGAFGLWAFLLAWSGHLGRPDRTPTAARVFGVGLVFAAIDEATQAIPIVQRTAGFDDYLANAAGLVCGCIAAMIAGRVLVHRLAPRPSPDPAR